MNIKKLIAAGIMAMVTLTASAEPTVTDVVAKQRYPWNGLMDIACKEQRNVTVGFVVENVGPMFVFDPTTAEGLVLLLTYFFVIASLLVRHRHFPPNVVVEWLGWAIYECELMPLQGGNTITETVVSRNDLGGSNQFRKLLRISNEILVE